MSYIVDIREILLLYKLTDKILYHREENTKNYNRIIQIIDEYLPLKKYNYFEKAFTKYYNKKCDQLEDIYYELKNIENIEYESERKSNFILIEKKLYKYLYDNYQDPLKRMSKDYIIENYQTIIEICTNY